MSDSFATPWTIAHQAPLSMGFPRQEYQSGLSFPSPGDLPKPGIKPASPALADRFFTTEPSREPGFVYSSVWKRKTGIVMSICRRRERTLFISLFVSEPGLEIGPWAQGPLGTLPILYQSPAAPKILSSSPVPFLKLGCFRKLSSDCRNRLLFTVLLFSFRGVVFKLCSKEP